MERLTRREFLAGAVSAGAGLASSSGVRAEPADKNRQPKRPNVVLIMTDQQRADSIGAYGNPIVTTPNIDSLAETGVLFENCHSQNPVCMPARATLFTGRYPAAHGVWNNGIPLPETETTLAGWLSEHGYRTGGAGKFHFIPHYPYRNPSLPTMENHPEPYYGFQEFHLGEDGRSGEHHLWIRDHFPEYANKPDHEIPPEVHNSHWVATHTIDFIERTVRKGEPFFAFCSFVDPHHGYNPPSPYREMYREEEMPSPIRREGELENAPAFIRKLAESFEKQNQKVAYNRSQYYGEVTFIDDSVGRILKTLDDLGVREDTILVFISDHGDMLGDHWLYYKGNYHYRACSQVPFIINWKGSLPAGRRVQGMVQQTDLFPTITALVGIDHPPGIQGQNLVPVLKGETDDTGYEFAYIESISSGAIDPEGIWTHPRLGTPKGDVPSPHTIRDPRWRFTYYPGAEYGELFDLEKDPDEFVNHWDDAAYQETKHALLARLLERVIRTRDPLPPRITYY